MTKEMTEDELSIFDILYWFWSYRYLAIVVFGLGSGAGISLWATSPTQTLHVETYSVFPGGTPVRSYDEVLEMAARAVENATEAVSISRDPAGLKVVFEEGLSPKAANASIELLEEYLISEVNQLDVILSSATPDNAAALPLAVKSKLFRSAYESGYLRLVSGHGREAVTPKSLRLLFGMLLGSCGVFFVIAFLHSVLRSRATMSNT